MTGEERSALVDEIVAALDARGALAGSWMVDIATVRDSLRAADRLLLGMQAALVNQAASGAHGA